jgi:hypothetical protein
MEENGKILLSLCVPYASTFFIPINGISVLTKKATIKNMIVAWFRFDRVIFSEIW